LRFGRADENRGDAGGSTRNRAKSDVSTFDPAGMEERMDAIRLKQMLGAPLTERELMCLQIEQNGMACHARPLRHIPLNSYPSQEDPCI
jgi:hypothetical protein